MATERTYQGLVAWRIWVSWEWPFDMRKQDDLTKRFLVSIVAHFGTALAECVCCRWWRCLLLQRGKFLLLLLLLLLWFLLLRLLLLRPLLLLHAVVAAAAAAVGNAAAVAPALSPTVAAGAAWLWLPTLPCSCCLLWHVLQLVLLLLSVQLVPWGLLLFFLSEEHPPAAARCSCCCCCWCR